MPNLWVELNISFINDCTHYTWVYVLKRKELFKCFLEWKALVENCSGRKLPTDNGGEYLSTKFGEYLSSEGICHEHTVPKTPELNGVAERMNRSLVETLRSMPDAKLPHNFWADAISFFLALRI